MSIWSVVLLDSLRIELPLDRSYYYKSGIVLWYKCYGGAVIGERQRFLLRWNDLVYKYHTSIPAYHPITYHTCMQHRNTPSRHPVPPKDGRVGSKEKRVSKGRRKKCKRSHTDVSLVTVVVHVLLYTLLAIFLGLFLFVLCKTWSHHRPFKRRGKTTIMPVDATPSPQHLRAP